MNLWIYQAMNQSVNQSVSQSIYLSISTLFVRSRILPSRGKPVTVILPIGRPGPTELYRSNPAVEVSVLQAANELGRFERVTGLDV